MPAVAPKLVYTSRPAFLMGLIGSAVLMVAAMWIWLALGPDIRARVSLFQVLTLLGFVLVMAGFMLSIGFSKVWADPAGVTVRNMFRVRNFPLSQILGVRMRKGDPWAYLLVANPDGDEPTKHAILAIQSAEGKKGMTKVLELRRWLDHQLNGDPETTDAPPCATDEVADQTGASDSEESDD